MRKLVALFKLHSQILNRAWPRWTERPDQMTAIFYRLAWFYWFGGWLTMVCLELRDLVASGVLSSMLWASDK